MKKRLDHYLVELGLSPSRTKAKELIELGHVVVGNQVILSSSYKVSVGQKVLLKENELLKFVSRAGLKLEGALKFIGLDVTEFRVFDVGLSTGGFSDCLLQKGAHKVVGIDVGHGQLAKKLRQNRRLIFFDGVNAKNISHYSKVLEHLQKGFDLLVMDVSFISQTSVLPSVLPYVKKEGHVLVLVKPQFELSSHRLNKRGIVKEKSDYSVVEKKLKLFYAEQNLQVLNYFESSIEGRDGNKEFFIYAKK